MADLRQLIKGINDQVKETQGTEPSKFQIGKPLENKDRENAAIQASKGNENAVFDQAQKEAPLRNAYEEAINKQKNSIETHYRYHS